MDSAHKHDFAFNEAVSLMVNCRTQKEVDYYWKRLGAGGDPRARQCGWLKDPFGVSWQVAPSILADMMRDNDSRKSERVMKALRRMKKPDIAPLKRACAGSA